MKRPYYVEMTANEFNEWLSAMKISGAEAARLLDVNVNTITRYTREGGSRMLALACAYLKQNKRMFERNKATRTYERPRVRVYKLGERGE